MDRIENRHAEALSLRHVIVEGKLRHVSEFAQGPRDEHPEARCPTCQDIVILKFGKRRAHHAAHRSGSTCKAATDGETALHINAVAHLCSQLATVTGIEITERCQGGRNGRTCSRTITKQWPPRWSFATAERQLGRIRPDITLTRAGIAVAAVEVFVSSSVDGRKAKQLEAIQLPWIEVHAKDVMDSVPWTARRPLSVRQSNSKFLCQWCQGDSRPAIGRQSHYTAAPPLRMRCVLRRFAHLYPADGSKPEYECFEAWEHQDTPGTYTLRSRTGFATRIVQTDETTDLEQALDQATEMRAEDSPLCEVIDVDTPHVCNYSIRDLNRLLEDMRSFRLARAWDSNSRSWRLKSGTSCHGSFFPGR